jgi:MSHA biogenesis protein MshN
MSLINKMLQDLEARDGTTRAQTNPVAHDNLRAVRYAEPKKSSHRLLLIAILIVVAAGAGVYHFFGFPWSTQSAPTVARAPSPAAIPAPTPRQEAPTPPPATATVAPEPVWPPAAPAETPVKLTPSQKSPQAATETATLKPVELVPAKPEPKPELKPEPKPTVVASAPAVAPVPPAPKPARAPAAKKTKAVASPAPAPAASATIPTKTIGDEAPSVDNKGTVEKEDRPITPQEQAEGRYREAAQLMSQGRTEDARTALNAALAKNPAHHQARELLVALAMQGGRLREAQDLLVQGLKVAPARLSFALLLARVQVEQGGEASAIATLEGVRASGAGNADYFSFLAALYQRSGRHSEAVAAYREAIGVRAQDARAWLGLGISLEGAQDPSGAAGAYQRALSLGGLDPNLTQYTQQRLAAVKK